eukprot:3204376-Pyramimonas_sp.AAC.2
MVSIRAVSTHTIGHPDGWQCGPGCAHQLRRGQGGRGWRKGRGGAPRRLAVWTWLCPSATGAQEVHGNACSSASHLTTETQRSAPS